MSLTHENTWLFWKLFVSSYKESSHGESKIYPFPNVCPSYLNKVWTINSFRESCKSWYLEIRYKVLINKVLIKIQNLSFIHLTSFKFIETTQKCLIFWNSLGVLTNKVLIKSSKFVLHSIYFLEIFWNPPKMIDIFEFIR